MSNKKFNLKGNKFNFVYTTVHSIYGIYSLMKEADDIAVDSYKNGDIDNYHAVMELLIQYTNSLSDLKELYEEEKEMSINFPTLETVEKDEPKIMAFQIELK